MMPGLLFVAVGHPRTTVVTIFQAIALILAATPLTFRLGAVGTAIGVGVAFVVGLLVTYYFVRRTLPSLSLREAFFVPTIALALSLAADFLLLPHFHPLALPLVIQSALETVACIALYTLFTFLFRPALTVNRSRYIWGLLTHRGSVATDGGIVG